VKPQLASMCPKCEKGKRRLSESENDCAKAIIPTKIEKALLKKTRLSRPPAKIVEKKE